MAFIDKDYVLRSWRKRCAKTKTGDTCCMSCRKCAARRSRADRHKSHRRK